MSEWDNEKIDPNRPEGGEEQEHPPARGIGWVRVHLDRTWQITPRIAWAIAPLTTVLVFVLYR